MIRRGEIWWAELREPRGSEPGFRRPLVIVQDDAFNRSALPTVIGVVVTSNLALADVPGNVLLSRAETSMKRDSVALGSAIVTVDRAYLDDPGVPIARLRPRTLRAIEHALALVLGLPMQA